MSIWDKVDAKVKQMEQLVKNYNDQNTPEFKAAKEEYIKKVMNQIEELKNDTTTSRTCGNAQESGNQRSTKSTDGSSKGNEQSS